MVKPFRPPKSKYVSAGNGKKCQQLEQCKVRINHVCVYLGGGFKHFLFSSLFVEDSHFDEHIFQMGGSTTN